jgi:putative peptidoglycan lipid II flippase
MAALVINVVLNLILMWPLKIGGLALATSISGICNFSILFYILTRRIGRICGPETLVYVAKTAVASVVMALALYAGKVSLVHILPAGRIVTDAAYLLSLLALGMAVYFAALYALRVRELEDLIRWIRKK